MSTFDQFLQAKGVHGTCAITPVAKMNVPTISLQTLQRLATSPAADNSFERAAAYAADRHSDEYERRIKSVLRNYERAMESHALVPYPGEPAAIAAYLERDRYRIGSVTRAAQVRTIRAAHLERGFDDPMLHDILRDKLESLERRTLVRNLDVRPFLVHDYLKLRPTIPRDLRGLRDRAAIGIGFEGFLFSGPIAAMDVRDVRIDVTGATIALKSARSSVFIPRRGPADAVTDLEEYIALAGIQTGPLFRCIDRYGQLETQRLTTNSICQRCFRERLTFAGFDGRAYRFSSLRAGHLVSAELLGVDELQLASRAGIRSGSTLSKWRRRSKKTGILRQ
jgi:hypothetical protein